MFSLIILSWVLSQIPVAPQAPYLAEPPNGVGAILPGPPAQYGVPYPSSMPWMPPYGPAYDQPMQNIPYQPSFSGGQPAGGWTYVGSYNVPQYYHVYRPWKWVPTYSVQWHVEPSGPTVTTGGGTGPVQPHGHFGHYDGPGHYDTPAPPYYGPSHPTPSWWGPQTAPAQPPQQQQMMQQQQQTSNNVIVVQSTSSRKELPTLESLRRKHRQEVERCFVRF